MNTKKIFKSTLAMIMASLVMTAGAAVATTNIVDAGTVTVNAQSVHEFTIRNFKAVNRYGGEIKTNSIVDFSADLSEADAGSYNWYSSAYISITKENVEHAKINFQAGDSRVTWYPKEAGTYKAKMVVYDSRGNRGISETTVKVKNLDNVEISEFTINPVYGSKLSVGNTLRFDYEFKNAAKQYDSYNCAYIEVMKDGVQHAYIDLNTSNPQTTWSPREHGYYTAKLTLSDFNGKYAVRTIGFDVEGRASDAHIDYLSAYSQSSTHTVGAPIKFNYMVSNAYENYGRYTNATINIRKGGVTPFDGTSVATVDVNIDKDRDTWKWTPTEAGKYILVFNFTDGYRHYDMKSIAIEVNEKVAVSSSITRTKADVGQTATFRATASKGAGGYQYKYEYYVSGAGYWKTIKDFSSTTSITHKFTASGTHKFRVTVKDANEVEVTSTRTVTVSPAMTAVTCSVSRTNMDVGQTVTITGSASKGSGGYQYTYDYKKSGDSAWTSIKKYTKESSLNYAPTSAGTYLFRVVVMDSNGLHVASSSKTVTVKSALVNNSTVKVSNKTIKATGIASGGAGGYKYCFYYKTSSASAYTVSRSFDTKSTTNTHSITLSKAGTYNVCVGVRDNNNRTIYKYFTVTVK